MLPKILNDVALVLLIAPTWSTQPWYAMLLQLAIAHPIMLNQTDHLLTLPHMATTFIRFGTVFTWQGGYYPAIPLCKRIEAIRVMNASWFIGTDKEYNTVWKTWSSWCTQKQIDILRASINEAVNFLAGCFADEKSYSTVNTYGSALSSTCVM